MNKIALIGNIGSGKGTVSDFLVSNYGYQEHSFASPLKDVLSIVFGWDRKLIEGDTKESRDFRNRVDVWWSKKLHIKNFTPRMAMQLVGTDAFRNIISKDIWVSCLERKIHSLDSVVVSDARFTNEIDMLSENGFKLLWVKQKTLPVWFDIAKKANQGCSKSLKTMKDEYPDVHKSEWDWVGNITPDIVIHNDGGILDLYDKVRKIIS